MNNGVLDLANALKLVTQNVCFGELLFFVRQVLVVASAALSEVFAFGGDAVWGGFEDFKNLAAGEVLFFLGQLNPNGFAGQAEGNEDGATACPCGVGETSHCFAAIGEFFEGDFVLRGGHAWIIRQQKRGKTFNQSFLFSLSLLSISK